MNSNYLVVGLGNPGIEYSNNRHNIGFQILDYLAEKNNLSWRINKKINGLETKYIFDNKNITLLKPLTFMNDSGISVRKALDYYDIPISNLIIIHDELDIDFERIRLKNDGGEGGHNGLKSISNHIGTKKYTRIRIGIGRPPGRMNVANFVLQDFSKVEKQEIPFIMVGGIEALEAYLKTDLSTSQNFIHEKY